MAVVRPNDAWKTKVQRGIMKYAGFRTGTRWRQPEALCGREKGSRVGIEAEQEDSTALIRLRLGVTGHRVLAAREKIAAGVDLVLDRCQDRVPGGRLLLLSPLAEGGDRIVAERVLARPGCALHATLPLRLEECLQDFLTESSKEEFRTLLSRAERIIELPAAASRPAAYAAAGRYILEHIDALIAIWDGRDAQGPSGTAEIVRLARSRGLPLAWVRAGNRRPDTGEATTLGADQGTAVFERW